MGTGTCVSTTAGAWVAWGAAGVAAAASEACIVETAAGAWVAAWGEQAASKTRPRVKIRARRKKVQKEEREAIILFQTLSPGQEFQAGRA